MAKSNQSAIRFARVLRSLPKRAQKDIKAAIMAEAGKTAAYMKIKAPKDTGALAESIRIEDVGAFYVRIRAGGPTTTVRARKGWFGGTYDYALAIEFGHRTAKGKHVPAQPFFYSTARASRRRVKALVREKARNALKKAYENA